MIRVIFVRSLWVGVLVAMMLSACGKGSNRGAPSTNKPAPVGDIALNVLDVQVQEPAVVSVSFKAKTALDEPVPNLTLDDFTVSENGSAISLFEAQPSLQKDPDTFVYSTLLLLDLSGSVLASSLEELKTAAKAFVSTALGDDSLTERGAFLIKLAYFDGRAGIHVLSDYSADEAALLAALDGVNETISQDSSTNLYGAVIAGIGDVETAIDQTYFANTSAAGSLVVFSDGNDQAARRTQADAFTKVDDATDAMTIFSIGLGSEIDPEVLNRLGRDGSQAAGNINELTGAFDAIAQRINDEVNSIYVFRYCSPKRSGAENTLTLDVQQGDKQGSLTTVFSAEGFRGGCQL